MTLFFAGLAVMAVCIFLSDRLGDQHTVPKTGAYTIIERLTKIIPQPVHVGYGIAFGGLLAPLGVFSVLLVGLGAAAYEKWGERNPYYEWEDVRDVVLGALIGWFLAGL